MSGIVEIRDYTIEAEHFAVYKEWANKIAAPWLKSNLDVIEFWMDDGSEAEVAGSNPQVSENGQANVCWIIRWESREERETEFRKRMSHPEWQEIWSQHPCPDAYLHMNARFMKAATTP